MSETASRILPAEHPAASTLFVTDPSDLAAIHDPSVNICVWRRSVPAEVERFTDTVVLPRDIKRVLTCSADAPDIDGLLHDVPGEPGFTLLRDDLLELARLCARITGSERLTLKLESFGSNLCERFHVDWVPLRLVCSCAGPGTEWLDSGAVDRQLLGPGAGDLPDELSGLLRLGAVIHRMARWDVALMKGERWPDNAGNGLVHRSPRIANSGVRRVLFKIDPAPGVGDSSCQSLGEPSRVSGRV